MPILTSARETHFFVASTEITSSGVVVFLHVKNISLGIRSGLEPGNGCMTVLFGRPHLSSARKMSLGREIGARKAIPFRGIFRQQTWDDIRSKGLYRWADNSTLVKIVRSSVRVRSTQTRRGGPYLSVNQDRVNAKDLHVCFVPELQSCLRVPMGPIEDRNDLGIHVGVFHGFDFSIHIWSFATAGVRLQGLSDGFERTVV